MLPQLSYAIKTQLTHLFFYSRPAHLSYGVFMWLWPLQWVVSPPLCCQAGACSPPACCPSGSSTLDICGCCHVCAGAEGEACGGPWDAQGSCGAGLRCFRQCGGLRQHYYHDNNIIHYQRTRNSASSTRSGFVLRNGRLSCWWEKPGPSTDRPGWTRSRTVSDRHLSVLSL